MHALLLDYPVIRVDPEAQAPWEHPEGLVICKFRAHEVANVQYDGVEITVIGDMRDINNDLYKLEAIGGKPTNRLLYTKPALDASIYEDATFYDLQENVVSIKKGRSSAITKYAKLNDEEKKKKYVIHFPEDMMLTDAQFMGQGVAPDDTDVEANVILAHTDSGLVADGNQIKTFFSQITWKLCNVTSKEEITGLKSKGAKGLAKAQARLAGMGAAGN